MPQGRFSLADVDPPAATSVAPKGRFSLADIDQPAVEQPSAEQVEIDRLNADTERRNARVLADAQTRERQGLSALSRQTEQRLFPEAEHRSGPLASGGDTFTLPGFSGAPAAQPFGTLPADVPVAGAIRAAKAIPQLSAATGQALTMGPSAPSEETMRAGNELIEGSLQALTPAVVAGAVLNPVQTGFVLLMGSAGQIGGEAAANAVGASPEARRLAGNLGALIAAGRPAQQAVSEFIAKNRSDIHILAEELRRANAEYDRANPPEPAIKNVTPEGPRRGIREDAPQLMAENPALPPTPEPSPVEPVAPTPPPAPAPPPAPVVPTERVWADLQTAAKTENAPAMFTARAELLKRGIPDDEIQAAVNRAFQAAAAPAAQEAIREVEPAQPADIGPSPAVSEEGRAASERVLSSAPSGRETVEQRQARRDEHYGEVFQQVVDAAKKIDPNVDEAELRHEFDQRLHILEELDKEYEDSGHNPQKLLKQIAKYGGLSEEGERGGYEGELKWIRESPANGKFGTFGGVKGVFQKRTLVDTQAKTGLSLDDMARMLSQAPEFGIDNIDSLLAALENISRHGGGNQYARDTFPGTAELRQRAGVRLEEPWWVPPAPAEQEHEEAEPQGQFTAEDLDFDPVTLEAQARLPEAGAVRDEEHKTPEFEAPFSLMPEAAQTTAVEPSLFDAKPEPQAEAPSSEEAKPEVAEPASVAQEPAAEPTVTGPVTVRHNTEQGGIEVKFAEKPEPEQLQRLKANGFKWSKRQGLWYRKAKSDPAKDVELTKKMVGETSQREEPAAVEPPAAPKADKAKLIPQRTEDGGVKWVPIPVTETPGTGVSSEEGHAGNQSGEPAVAGAGAPEPARAGSRGVLEAVPAEDRGEPEAEQRPASLGESGEAGVTPGRVSDDGADVERAVAPDGGGDDPAPVAVSPAGAKGDPGTPHGDYVLTPERIESIIGRGTVGRIRDNLAAIALVKQLKAENRYATSDEQETLAKYVGWGASDMARMLADYQPSGLSDNERKLWQQIRDLPDEERAALKRSTPNAHFTFDLYAPIWKAIENAGFTGGNVLEPAVGVGHAFGFMPPDMRVASTLNASELEPLTASIAGYLYPSATVQAVGYEKALIARGTQDLIISNVPFGDFGVQDPRMDAFLTDRIHNYFFAKALEHARPGGLVVFVTSRYTMDSVKHQRVRDYLLERADFLGAVRLPNSAFDKSAKTEVVTDVIVLRRKQDDGAEDKNAALFSQTGEHPTLASSTYSRGRSVSHRVNVSRWFLEHPELVLGTESLEGSMYGGGEYTVTAPREGVLASLEAALPAILPPGSYQRPVRAVRQAKMAEGPYKPGELRVSGKKIVRVAADGEEIDATPMAKGKPDVRAFERLKGMVELRDILRDVRNTMRGAETSDADIVKAQKRLTKAYDAYVDKHGYLNDQANKRLFAADPEAANLLALEKIETKASESTNKAGKTTLKVEYKVTGRADIFTKRVIQAERVIEKADSPKDALLASLGTYASVDWPYMAKITGQSVKALQTALQDDGLVFEQPDGSHVIAEEYLSGDVVTKLEDAKAAGRKFAANVKALEAVQPAKKTRDDIETGAVSVNLGALWVDPNDVAKFATEQLGGAKVDVRVVSTSSIVTWRVVPSSRAESVARQHPLAVKYNLIDKDRVESARDTFDFLQLLNAALNLKAPDLGHWEGSGDEKYWVKEPEATLAARANIESLRSEWQQYVYREEGLQDRVLETYNTRYNRTVERRFDGSHLTLPGKNETIKFYPHQLNAVWRILTTGNTLLAHEVGAGKTFEMIAAAMEMRRTGRAKKVMITVPTFLLAQWRRDVLLLYPEAKLAAFDEKDLAADRRQQAMARIAYGDWDIVLVPHSSFGLLKPSDERVADMMQRWIAEIEAAEKAEEDGSESQKQLERARRRIEDKMQRKMATVQKSKDNALRWEELGVDALMIDEAHAFKNLFFYSKIENLRGLSRSESDRSLGLYVKVQEINEQSHYRNLVLATATPVMNSMAEAFTVQRYLQPQVLRQYGFDNFDNWYATFAAARPTTEQQPDGTYKEVMRLRDFSNLQLLSKMVRGVMDYVGWEDMPYLDLPKLEGGKIDIVQTEPHPMYGRIKEWFAVRMQRLRDNPPHYDFHKKEYKAPYRVSPLNHTLETAAKDNILAVMGDAKKAAVDVRLVVGDAAKDYKGSRIQTAVDNMVRIYKAESKKKGVQLVFLDMGTPKSPAPLEFMKDVTVEDATEGELDEDKPEASDEGGDQAPIENDDFSYNLYDELKAALVKRGVPSREIAFIHSARNAAERLALFTAAQEGKVRFVFASTDKGGVGMNIQTRLAAMHEIDAPRYARPGDLRQRMGRIIRQGNTYKHVRLYRYVTKGTTDEWLWGLVTTKDYQVQKFMRGEATNLSEEDPSTMSLQEAQIRASGDPRGIELTELKGKLARLQAQAASAERAVAAARADVQRGAESKRHAEADLESLRTWLKTYKSLRGDNFALEVRGETYTKRDDANKAIGAFIQKALEHGATGRDVQFGRVGTLPLLYRVFDTVTSKNVPVKGVTIKIDANTLGVGQNTAVSDTIAPGMFSEFGVGQNLAAQIVNEYERIPNYEDTFQRRAAEASEKVAAAERVLKNPPKVIDEAKRAAHRIAEIEAELTAEGLANEEARKAKPKEEEKPEPKKDGGVTLQATVIPGAAEFGEYVLTPAAKAVAEAVRHDMHAILTVLSPASVGVAPFAADVIRAHNAAHDQRMGRTAKVLEDMRRVMASWSREDVLRFADVMEGVTGIESIPAQHRQFAQLMRTLLDRWKQTLEENDLLESYIEHYFPHEWKRPSMEGDFIRSLMSRRPIQGREAFRKRRVIPTIREGVEYGLEPVSWNPADLLMRKITEMSKSVNARAMQQDLKNNGFLVYVPAEKASKAQLPDEIRTWERIPENALGVVYGQRAPEQAYGKVIAGYYYAPPEVARLLKNYISPGLHGRSKLFDAYKAVGNTSTSFLLGWSSFHMWLIGLESIISKQSLVVEAAARGRWSDALTKQFEVGPQGIAKDLLRGYKAVKEFYSRDADANDVTGIIGQIIQGGGGLGWSDLEHEAAPRKFMDDMSRLYGAVRRAEAGEAAKSAAKGAVHGAAALFELPTDLIMTHWVPYLKVAAFLDMAEFDLSSLPADATLADKRRVLSEAWDTVDDRFGQLRYANLFWDNTFKQLLTGGFLSVGWQVGSIRAGVLGSVGQVMHGAKWLKSKIEGGGSGGGGGKPPSPNAGAESGGFEPPKFGRRPNAAYGVTRAGAWLFTLMTMVVVIDALYQYLRTGKMLGEDDKGKFDFELALRDAYFPRDGRTGPSGRAERRSIVSYAKDYIAWTRHPVTTLEHKLKPILHTIADIVENEDFFGNAIYDEEDTRLQQWKDVVTYAAKSHAPIGWQNAVKLAGDGAPFKETLKQFALGQLSPFTPASAEFERSSLENYLNSLIPPAHRSKEEAAKAQSRREVRTALQSGDMQAAMDKAKAGGLSRQSVQAVARSNRMGPLRTSFQRTSWPEAVHAMSLATEDEKAALKPQFFAKARKAMEEARSDKDRTNIRQAFERIYPPDRSKS